jgi:hypothetical protein
MPAKILRIVAVLLLLTGATDFLSFDRADLFESMNPIASVKAAARDIHCVRQSRPAGVTQASMPDDGCLFCGIGFPAGSVVMPLRLLVSEFKTHYALTDPAFLSDSPHPPPKVLAS